MVKLLPEENSKHKNVQNDPTILEENIAANKTAKNYEDAESSLYVVGDLIDVKDREQGTWLEGKIVRIVYDPDAKSILDENNTSNVETEKEIKHVDLDKESDVENEPPRVQSDDSPKIKKRGVAKYFCKAPRSKKQAEKETSKNTNTKASKITMDLLYKIQLDDDNEDSELYCKESEIRPRARNVLDVMDLKKGQKVMLNYNTDEPSEKGHWYDFRIDEIKKFRSSYELIGTLYLGVDSVPQNDTKVKVHDKIFVIEEVVPVDCRTEEYKIAMITQPEKSRTVQDCGCCVCLAKESPETIVLCDECDMGYHTGCLRPALARVPDGDWYCPRCARDPASVVAPGAARQLKKRARSTRDWGRGMACAGKTKTCAMPPNHFGPIPGIEVGTCWRFRIQLSESGVHRPPVSGIHGRDVEGAYSIVLSGGYEDDVDNGNEFTYTGSGGRDLSGNKRTAEQSCDQTLTRENKALARNCAVAAVSEAGGDAGDEWREGRPVRVVRSYKMLRHFPKYAPQEGIRYDGIYKVVKYYPEKGISGFRVWKYLLRRDDPSPAPWEPGAKQYPIIYPDGYLEAEAEKKALKDKKIKSTKGNKKRALRENNQSSDSEAESSPPVKKLKTLSEGQTNSRNKGAKKTVNKSPPKTIPNIFSMKSPKNKNKAEKDDVLTTEEKEAIEADCLNKKLWRECLEVCKSSGKKEFVERVTQVFLCIICQEVTVNPVTTPCSHNFCSACLRLAFRSTESPGCPSCPCCRRRLAAAAPVANERLRAALRAVMPGYDAGKK
ncbi:unnamed protein product, partial [Iphiclides podalirius]